MPLFLTLLVLISSCIVQKEPKYHTYKLETGDIVECASEDWYGGLRQLSNCKNITKVDNPRNVIKLD